MLELEVKVTESACSKIDVSYKARNEHSCNEKACIQQSDMQRLAFHMPSERKSL